MATQATPQPERSPPGRQTRKKHNRLHLLSQQLNDGGRWVGSWVYANTFAPRWLPERLRHPLVGYYVALLVQLVAIGLTLLILSLFPTFAFLGVLMVVGVALLALGWGAAPSLFGTLVGALMLYFVLLPPNSSLKLAESADGTGLFLCVLAGLSISLLAGRSERARRQQQEQSRLLAEARASSDLEARRLRTVLEVLPSAVIVSDSQGHFSEVNQAAKMLWGEGPLDSEIANDTPHHGWWTRTGEPLAVEDWALARALSRGEASVNEELEIETYDGERKSILHSAAPIRNEAGAITGAVSNAQDISELRRLEQEVAERAAQLETIFESIADGVIVTDRQGRLVHMNHVLQTLLGIDQDPTGRMFPELEVMAGFTPYNVQGNPLADDERPLTRYLQGEVLNKQKSVDILLRTRDERELLVNLCGAPIRDAGGQIIGCVEIVRDVTERRRLEQHTRGTLDALVAMAEALVQAPDQKCSPFEDTSTVIPGARHLAEMTRHVLGNQHVSIAAIEPGTKVLTPITVVSTSLEKEQEWWAMWEGRQVQLKDIFSARQIAVLHAGEPVSMGRKDVFVAGAQEHRLDGSFLLVPMRVGQTLVGVLRLDEEAQEEPFLAQERQPLIMAVARLGALVLERERLLREHAEARANELALRETQEQMDTFLGVMGHEFKNPLAGVQLGLQLAQRRLRRQAAQHKEMGSGFEGIQHPLTRAEQQVQFLERLVNDVLDTTRVRAGKLELRPVVTDLAAIVSQAVEAQRQGAPTRALLCCFPVEQPVLVFADADRIGQVVTNYLTNAFKYSPAERPVEIGLDVEGQHARVWVRDEGPGIPYEEQRRIWERFHRVKGTEAQSGGAGLGLGLHICRTMIEQHHGQVGVESIPGQGSTFWFVLPLAAV